MVTPISTPDSAAAYRGRVKYTAKTAREYQNRDPRKHRSEMRLIDRAFKLIPGPQRALDVPCGGARVAIHLADKGNDMSCGDLSEAMLDIASGNIANAGLQCPVERQDVEALSHPDRHFDSIVCFRLFHHFPDQAIRRRVVRELCRVAREFVVLSYMSTMSVTAVKRRLQASIGGKKSGKHYTPLKEVRGYFEEAGFELVEDFAEMPIIHSLHLAVFKRRPQSGDRPSER